MPRRRQANQNVDHHLVSNQIGPDNLAPPWNVHGKTFGKAATAIRLLHFSKSGLSLLNSLFRRHPSDLIVLLPEDSPEARALSMLTNKALRSRNHHHHVAGYKDSIYLKRSCWNQKRKKRRFARPRCRNLQSQYEVEGYWRHRIRNTSDFDCSGIACITRPKCTCNPFLFFCLSNVYMELWIAFSRKVWLRTRPLKQLVQETKDQSFKDERYSTSQIRLVNVA